MDEISLVSMDSPGFSIARMHMIPIGSGFISMDCFVWENLHRKNAETIVFIINYMYVYIQRILL